MSMEGTVYTGVRTQDIPFDIFTLFSRGNQSVHARALLTTAAMCAEDIEGAAPYDAVAAVLGGFADQEDEDASADLPEAQELGVLKKYGLIRRQGRYSQADRKWTDYVYMTGRGQKVADFLVSISQMDIQQTKEANIQGALLSMREAASDSPSEGILLYDALKAAHEGILDLITHLSTYSASFRDFIEANTKKIENTAQAKEWMDSMFHSNFLTEYFVITETAYLYSAKLAEIRQLAQKIKDNENTATRIVDQEYIRRKGIAKKTNILPDMAEIRRDVMARAERLEEMAGYEYHGYMDAIMLLVNDVIQRVYFVMISFGAGDDTNTVIDVIIQLLKYCEETGEEIPAGIINIYEHLAVDGESLCPPRSKNGEEDAPAAEEPDLEVFDTDTGITSRKQAALGMARGIIPPGGKAKAEDFPCDNLEQFHYNFILAGCADTENNPVSEFNFTPDGTTFIKGRYILPGGEYERVEQKKEDAS